MYHKLVVTTAVLAGSLLATVAQAQEPELSSPQTNSNIDIDYEVDKRRDQGWNSPWGLVFSFTNILQNGDFLENFQDLGAAGAMMLSPDFMIRGGVSFSRSHTPPQTTEVTLETGDSTVKTYQYNAGQTSSASFTLRGDAVYRLNRNKVAPYVGAGPYVVFAHSRQSSDDDVTVPDVVTSVRNRTTTITAGLRGLVGAEWRIHSNFAFFAEYAASIDVVRYTDIDNRTTVTNTVDGTTAGTSTRSERSTPAWFNVSNALSQGATLGLLVLF